ncbi:nucleolin-like [Phoenix dactylifera]|uniref:Nucleolin-like n=1 Tax=Phoenix dactylifera TaxID=42345 RepID=A0A8B7CNC6_PHODC|nr:nucleolin-like [Phoenix dactylifera]
MRTRNADAPKSGPAKKTSPPKKDSSAPAAADKTPEAAPKSTPKSGGKSAKGAAKKSAAKAAAASAAAASSPAPVPATPDAKPEPKVEEVATPADEKKLVSAVKSPPEKKASGKAKSPLGGRAAAAARKVEEAVDEPAPPKVEDATEEPLPKAEEDARKEEVKEDEDAKAEAVPDAKAEAVPYAKAKAVLDAKDEPESNPVRNEGEEAAGDRQMEEEGEPEGFQEPVEEFVGGEEQAAGREGQEAVMREEEEEGARMEEDEHIEISDMAKKRKMKKEQEIFVGGLDRDAVEQDIKKAFEKIGEVVEVRLHKDFATNKNKGFAFVKFSSKELAAKALSELKNPIIRGKRCGIAPSEDNDTLFLGNICNTWTKEAIRRKLKDYGVDRVENITLVEDTQNEGLSRGFAFLEFSCHEDAMLAYKRLQKPDVIFGHPERTGKVAFAEPLREPDPEVMAQVKSVFVDGLPPYWDEDRVKEQFKAYGEIERVVLARNMSTARRKDFGFVNFTTHEAAVACVEGVNHTELGDWKSKMKARARLANPLPKTQAVKGGMSGGFRIGHTGMGTYSRFGRGFGRGRYVSHRAGFHGRRGFNFRWRGRGGRFSFPPEDNSEIPPSEFHDRRPFGFRGGRGVSTSARHGAFDRGRGRAFPSRRPPYLPEEEFGGPFGARHLGEDPYFYGDVGHGIKRSFSMMEHDPGYLEPVSRIRPHFDHPEPLAGRSHYQDSLGMGGLYSHDYYGSDYGGSTYSSLYGGERSGGGYYY